MYKKKSLGQHFLHSSHYVRVIADAGAVAPGDTVIEIGPGEGVLTKELLARGAHVIAIEKDRRLIPTLTTIFSKEIQKKQFRIIEADILEVRLADLKLSQSYKVIANIPYYISGALLKLFLTAKHQPTQIVFLLQKEVARRIVRDTKESILSLSVKAYGIPHIVSSVPRGAFTPPPKVDSAILSITDISRKRFTNRAHEEHFFTLVHAGFGKKRKLLKRNIEMIFGEKVSEALQAAGIPQQARAEDISLQQWLLLALQYTRSDSLYKKSRNRKTGYDTRSRSK